MTLHNKQGSLYHWFQTFLTHGSVCYVPDVVQYK